MTLSWLSGLLRRRGARLLLNAIGIAVAVALLGSLGSFLAASRSTMTDRAARTVAVDWQVQLQPGGSPSALLEATRAAAGTRAALPVGFAHSTGLAVTSAADGATGATSTQTTGPAEVLGLPADYRTVFPDAIRSLEGSSTGVLVAQQTAANLHARPGDSVTIGRAGLPPVVVRVDGIVALPQADSLFQRVGAPVGAQPSAPPDNVLLLPDQQWHAVFDPLAGRGADAPTVQIHAARSHQLPPDPAAAYTAATAAAHNLEARTAGAGIVGDNLGAALDRARADAAYAQVLFLFLGAPGAVLAALLTAMVTATGSGRRRREFALLRARGMGSARLVGLAAIEAGLVGSIGTLAGLAVVAVLTRAAFGIAGVGGTAAILSAAGGLLIAVATVLGPAYRDLRQVSVAAGRMAVGPTTAPRWTRWGLDLVLLAGAGVIFWLTGRNGYQLVLAPEGVPGISVSYWAFAGPALLWIGAGLFAWRLVDLALGRGRDLVGRGLRPVAGNLAATASAMMSRRRHSLAGATVVLGLALAFAASTATFNSTYRAQAEVDAQLTNGADVTVAEPPGAPVGPAASAQFAGPGVRSVEPLQHRFAYVGADLQDLYGVNPATITNATALRDQYFQGGTARQLLDRLAAAPDSVLVSSETVADFQLQPGDLINLRLRDARTGALNTVPFHYVGVVNEFPTAPKDSFLVANAAYVAAHTGSDAVATFLVDTGGQNVNTVSGRIRQQVAGSATVTDITSTRAVIGSSLTAVDLAGLTRIELGFALALAAAAAGLVLSLGLAERRRGFAIATAIGASGGQLRRLIASEAAVLAVGGLLAGATLGWVLSEMLVAVLTGVFDPPPSALSVPWGYLVGAGALTLASLAVATTLTAGNARRSSITLLREL
ncbi:MAG TPA: FtsX-like permease family protein [Pseudonocardia sp.]|jgi:putative ABC transport system permease protein|uniref:FtsX-like permease family protein n=1 Tax=Pseudonocardia sp. TaxID=60912 RepID=UPI002EDADA4E